MLQHSHPELCTYVPFAARQGLAAWTHTHGQPFTHMGPQNTGTSCSSYHQLGGWVCAVRTEQKHAHITRKSLHSTHGLLSSRSPGATTTTHALRCAAAAPALLEVAPCVMGKQHCQQRTPIQTAGAPSGTCVLPTITVAQPQVSLATPLLPAGRVPLADNWTASSNQLLLYGHTRGCSTSQAQPARS
jgi:hypothetical protein